MTIVLRVDGGASIGAGHVMRCLALAQAAHDAGHRTVFLMEPGAAALKRRLRDEGCDVHDLPSKRGSREDALETAARAQEVGAACTVVDGYVFDTMYQIILKDAGIRFLTIDDYGHADTYHADLILNQNSYAQKLESIYRKRAEQSKLLLGSNYVLLRREYQVASPQQNTPDVARKILVTFGGGDTKLVTQRIIGILKNVDEPTLDVTVLIGGLNPHADEIESAAQGMHVIRDARNMPDLLAQTELAIAAGGTTAYELAYMGVPALLFTLAENQCCVAEDLHERGIVLSLGKPAEVTDDLITETVKNTMHNTGLRKDMAQKGHALVDGGGAQRVLEALLALES